MEKFKLLVKEWVPFVAILAVCLSSLFIGMVVGSVNTRADANQERTILVESFAQTIKTKDHVITLLAQSTVASTDAVLAQTDVTVTKAKTAETQASKAAAAASAEAKKMEAAAKARRAAEAKKLGKLK